MAQDNGGWTTSSKYKLGNYRSKVRQASCNEVSVNRTRVSDNEDEGRFFLEKNKQGEVSYVPDHPKMYMVDAIKKRGKNMQLIREKMDLTSSLRRKEIVEMEPMVSQMKWSALFFLRYKCSQSS